MFTKKAFGVLYHSVRQLSTYSGSVEKDEIIEIPFINQGKGIFFLYKQ